MPGRLAAILEDTMRILPLLTAITVTAALYLLLFERDRLMVLASGETTRAEAQPAVEIASPSESAEPERRVAVLVQKSRAQAVDSGVLARGRTEAARQVEVKAETSGLVVSEPLRRGAYVTAGQELCRLDPGTRLASLAEAEAVLAEAQINYNATSKLSQDGYASETKAASARAALQSAEAGVEAARREIARLTLTAPFEGILESDTAELGALLQPGATCANVIQLDPIKLVGFIPEADVDKVSVGAMAGARLITGREAVGRVSFLSRSADPETRTFRVEVTVANPDLAIRDGQTAEMLIAAEGRTAHLLPGSALTLDDDGHLGLRIVDADSRALFVPVTVLRDTAEGVWLTGLPDEADV
ncbi:MAG TPA: efflux RND transporter periplasmic adaptor subunit, partial [Paracoccaceae bacterium]